MGILSNLLLIAYLLLVMFTANMVQRGSWQMSHIRYMLYGVIFVNFLVAFAAGQFILLGLLPAEETQDLPAIDAGMALLVTLLTLGLASLGAGLMNAEGVRYWAARRLPSHYDPDSAVHLTAALLSLLLVSALMVVFLLQGGTAGVAESIAAEDTVEQGGSFSVVSDALFNLVMWLTAAFLGVGYAIRRTLPAALDRLGLHVPTPREIGLGALAGLGLWGVAIVFSIAWQLVTDPQVFEEQVQASQALNATINTPLSVLIVSLSAAFGEEIFLRGAMQPVFGIALTSVFFTLLHAQHLFAPSMLLIFGVSVALGLLRQRFGTPTAIAAHFVYNFVPLSLALLLTAPA